MLKEGNLIAKNHTCIMCTTLLICFTLYTIYSMYTIRDVQYVKLYMYFWLHFFYSIQGGVYASLSDFKDVSKAPLPNDSVTYVDSASLLPSWQPPVSPKKSRIGNTIQQT